MYDHLFHYALMALTTTIICLVAGITNGFASMTGIHALTVQPHAHAKISRSLLLGSALTETASLIALVITALFIKQCTFDFANPWVNYAEIGALFGLLCAGTIVTIATSLPVKAACCAIARQPLFAQEIERLMLAIQSIIQTPLIFAFITTLLIQKQLHTVTTLSQALRFIAAGLCIGVSSIGPTLGLGLFGQKVCQSLGINRTIYKKLFLFTFVTATIIESPLIFSFLITLFILKSHTIPASGQFLHAIGCLSAAALIALGTLGSGIALGAIARKAAATIAQFPEHYNEIRKTSLTAQIFTETLSIYSFLVAVIIVMGQFF